MQPEQNPVANFPLAEPWSMMTGQIGTGLVVGGIIFFAISALACLLQGRVKSLAKITGPALWLGSICIFGAMAALMTLFIKNQFQFEYVFARADVHTDLKYKIAGVWSGQQGSFLLWACASALFGLMALKGTGEYRRWYTLVFALFLGSLCGILAYETPFHPIHDAFFEGKWRVPPTGQGMTPTLQNYWVVIHPPTIFLGFGALTVLFAYAIAAILSGNLKDWIQHVRSWSMVALSLLGVGLIMGGLWAYETLGWGGFWAWDPVENTSFVPWIFLAAFVHGMIVQVNKGRWHGANLWLAALPFLSFTYGTFLTRSGYLTKVSVHSFAEMDKSALKILIAFLVFAVVSFAGIYLWKGRKLAKAADQAEEALGINREKAYGFGNLFLCLFATVVAIGMSWPVIVALTGKEAAVVEEHLYHQVLVWFFVPVMLLMAVAPFISWRTMTGRELIGRFLNVFSVSAGVTGFMLFGLKMTTTLEEKAFVQFPMGVRADTWIWIGFLLFLCVFVIVSSLWRIGELVRRTKTSLGGFVSHLGLAVLLAGLVVSRGLERHEKTFMRADETPTLMGYTIKNEGFTSDPMTDRENKSKFLLTTANGGKIEARPGMYYFNDPSGEQKAMVWPHIQRFWSHDVYFAAGEPIIFAWKDPVWFKPGESKTIDGVKVTYRKMVTKGEPGQPGTSFGADLLIGIEDKDGHVTETTSQPSFVIGEGPQIDRVDSSFMMAMTQMDVKDKSVALQLLFSSPIYQIELFNKPLTGLVWLGAGILLFGGLMTAYARRRPRKPIGASEVIDEAEVPQPEPVKEREPAGALQMKPADV